MVKPSHFGGYSDAYTVDCERVLVTLLRGLGPWKESVFLVGGLTPRYLAPCVRVVVASNEAVKDESKIHSVVQTTSS